jgi:hypothetical protein
MVWCMHGSATSFLLAIISKALFFPHVLMGAPCVLVFGVHTFPSWKGLKAEMQVGHGGMNMFVWPWGHGVIPVRDRLVG